MIAEAAPARGGKLEGVRVVGIFGSGDTGGAIVLVKGKKHRVSVSDTLDGWELKSVAPDRAVFVKGADTDEKLLSTVSTNVQYNTEKPAGPSPTPVPQAQQQEPGDDVLTLGR